MDLRQSEHEEALPERTIAALALQVALADLPRHLAEDTDVGDRVVAFGENELEVCGDRGT